MLRTIQLFRLFRAEQADPDSFYAFLGQDAAAQLAEHCELDGKVVVDVGGGAGYFASAFRARGASCCLFDLDKTALTGSGTLPVNAAIADGCALPLGDGVADACFSSNVLEHVPAPQRFLDEMVRIARPGGIIYVAFTNWYSPWGGHEMSPWHYLGAGFAQRRYARRHGHQPKHKVGISLFPLHIGAVLRHLRKRTDIEIIAIRPRYYPRWCRVLVYLPGIREVLAWNLLVILRRTR